MKRISLFLLSSIILLADDNSVVYVDENANRIYKDANASSSKAIGVNLDLGYTNYNIDVISTELERAIDYDVLELTVGLSSSYNKLLYGLSVKSLIHELKSNVNISESGNLLNDNATIDRKEIALYGVYPLMTNLTLNAVFRYAELDASDSYLSFVDYNTQFSYVTNGLALAVTFNKFFEKKHHIWMSTGAVYGEAKVKISEKVNAHLDDAYIDDSVNTVGYKLGAGYNYKLTKNIVLKANGDFYSFNFSNLEVSSHAQSAVLEKAKLNEETYSFRLGFSYRF